MPTAARRPHFNKVGDISSTGKIYSGRPRCRYDKPYSNLDLKNLPGSSGQYLDAGVCDTERFADDVSKILLDPIT